MLPRVAVDASNLVGGGGVQVASALLTTADGLLTSGADGLPDWLPTATWLVSSQVAEALPPLTTIHPTVTARRWRMNALGRPPYDAVATIFGPVYRLRRASVEVMGYADVTSVYPPLAGIERPTLRRRLRTWLSRMSVRDADAVVVETAALKERIVAFGVLADRVSVVPNTVHPAMTSDPDPAQVAQFRALRVPGATTFAYVTRLYPHKNLPFVAPVLAELARLGTEARCFVTLTDAEWAALGQAGQSRLVNVGSLTPPQVRALLEASDAVLFPSLLEAFSATPIEALQVERPLFAADRDFVRTVVGDAACYFDPSDVRAAAIAIEAGLADTDALVARVARGRTLMQTWPDATSRTRAFFAAIDGALAGKGA